jgi:hypothetical protein
MSAIVDLEIENHGSIALMRPHTEAAEEWIAETVDVPDWAWMGGAVAVEPRYVEALAIGASDAGLRVEGGGL